MPVCLCAQRPPNYTSSNTSKHIILYFSASHITYYWNYIQKMKYVERMTLHNNIAPNNKIFLDTPHQLQWNGEGLGGCIICGSSTCWVGVYDIMLLQEAELPLPTTGIRHRLVVRPIHMKNIHTYRLFFLPLSLSPTLSFVPFICAPSSYFFSIADGKQRSCTMDNTAAATAVGAIGIAQPYQPELSRKNRTEFSNDFKPFGDIVQDLIFSVMLLRNKLHHTHYTYGCLRLLTANTQLLPIKCISSYH